MAGLKRSTWSSAVLACLLLAVSGCSTLRLPAIDPTGESILLPPTSYTTLAKHHQQQPAGTAPPTGDRPGGCLERSGFEEPPEIPPCEEPPILPNMQPAPALSDCTPQEVYQPVVARVVNPSDCQDFEQPIPTGSPTAQQRDYRERVSLAPRRQIAPVGSEVVLIGGVCDEEGYYRIREPLQWTMAQGSVGQFTDPGDPAVGFLGLRGGLVSAFSEPRPEMCSNNMALSVSSRKVQVLTRGTTQPNDDVFVLEGQGWITVTSPVEGNTYVTLSAPELDGWQQRQESVVIHWIDGQWTLPTPMTAQSLQPQELTTRVCRRLTGSPVADWIVRYEIAGGAPTTFVGGAQVQEVVTDANGKATVQVQPPSAEGGVTQIRIQVIRPGGLEGSPGRLVVGDGTTTITWSSAQLQIRVQGPESVEVNQTATYRIEVTNPSAVAVNNVKVGASAPVGFVYSSSNPQGQPSTGRVEWMLAQLQPGQQQTLDITYQVTQSAPARVCATAEAAGLARIENCLTAQVTADALYIEMLGPNPEIPLPVGQTANYQVTVTNRGDQRLSDVLLVDRFDPGLQHGEGTSPIEWPLGALDPGQSRQLGLSFQIVAAGRHCHTLEATADGTRPARTSACVTAQTPQRSEFTVRKSGPPQMVAGGQGEFSVVIENTGEAPLANLQIIDSYDPELRPLSANPPEKSIEGGAVTWYVSQLAPGQTLTYRVLCQAVNDVRSTCSRVLVRAAGGLERTDEVCLPVFPPGAGGVPPASSALPPRLLPSGLESGREPAISPLPTATNSPRSTAGQLELTIDGRGDRWRVGDRIDYLIVIRNAAEQVDHDVALTVRLSPTLKLENYMGPVSAAASDSSGADGHTLCMIPLRTLRAGETVQFNVIGTVSEAGELVARAELTSMHSPRGVSREDKSLASP